MAVVALFLTHILHQNESHRSDMDKQLCHLESRSGTALHNFGSRARAKVSEYAFLKRDVHIQEATMAMARHCFTFQDQLSRWILAEMDKVATLITDKTKPDCLAIQSQSDHIRASLDLNASVALWTLEQLKALERRLTVQSRVVSSSSSPPSSPSLFPRPCPFEPSIELTLPNKIDSTISATDTLTMIRLARSSRSDSNTMKAITILTMVFLPATFVCSLFGMGFFDFGFGLDPDSTSQTSVPTTVVDQDHHHIRVANQFWVYFAVTVPLTILVLAICAAWLRWGDAAGDGDHGETDDTTALAKVWRRRKL